MWSRKKRRCRSPSRSAFTSHRRDRRDGIRSGFRAASASGSSARTSTSPANSCAGSSSPRSTTSGSVGRQLQPSRVARHGKPCGVGAGPKYKPLKGLAQHSHLYGWPAPPDERIQMITKQLHHSEHVREGRHERRDAEGRDPLGRDRDPAGAAELTTPMTRVGVALAAA